MPVFIYAYTIIFRTMNAILSEVIIGSVRDNMIEGLVFTREQLCSIWPSAPESASLTNNEASLVWLIEIIAGLMVRILNASSF